MALGATAEHFTDEDSAGRILPVVCPLLIDKEKMIRDSASRTVDVYLQRVRKAAASMPDSVLPPPQATDGNVPRMGTPQPTESSGWTGWAISSFTNKLSAAAGDMQTTNGSGASSPKPTSPGLEPKKPAMASASSLHRQTIKSPPPMSSRTPSATASIVAQSFLAADNDDDGGDSWGDMGDDDGFGTPTEDGAKKTAVSATPFDDGAEPDFAGWLAAQSQKKGGASKPLPKGLSKSTAAKKPMPKTTAKPAPKPVAAKKIDMKPKETDDDDGWGDGW